MESARLGWRRRMALRRLERALRAQDPALAAMLSGGPRTVLPPLRFESLSPRGYAVVGGLLLAPGMYLGVGSATFTGLLALVASAFRYVVAPPHRVAPLHRAPGERS